MIKAPHWQLKTHLHYIRTDGAKKSYDARFPVLMHLIMSANDRLRCFVGIETLCRDTGFSNKPVLEALQWLQDKGAIYNVPQESRVGRESQLHSNKKVWQLTSILCVGDSIINYLYTGEENTDTHKAFESLLSSIKENAPDAIKPFFDGKIHVQSTHKTEKVCVQSTPILEETDPSESEIGVQSTCKNAKISVQSTHKIHVQSPHEVINKRQAINKKEKDIKTMRYARAKEFFGLSSALLPKTEPVPVEEPKKETPPKNEQKDNTMTDDIQSLDDFFPDDKPAPKPEPPKFMTYTDEEYEYFVGGGRCSEQLLASSVYVPLEYRIELKDRPDIICNPCWQDRAKYRQPEKKLSDWQKTIAVVEEFFPVSSTGYATKVAQQLQNRAKRGDRKYFGVDPPMDALEACAFAYWLQEQEGLDHLPERAERIQERALQFRALPNHIEHMFHARYVLSDLLATNERIKKAKEKPEEPEAEPEGIASLEEQYAVLKEANEMYGTDFELPDITDKDAS